MQVAKGEIKRPFSVLMEKRTFVLLLAQADGATCHWAHLLGDHDAFKEARAAVLRNLHSLATEEIPAKAFESVRAFRRYLKDRPR